MSRRSWIVSNTVFFINLMAAFLASFLHSVGYLHKDQLPVTILALLVASALFMAIKNYQLDIHLNQLRSTLSIVEDKLSDSSTRVLCDTEELFGNLNKIITPNSKLEVTYFSQVVPDELSGDEGKKYWKTVQKNLLKSKDFRVKRIVSIESEGKLQWVRENMTDHAKSKNYHLRVLTTEQHFPLLNVIIVDSRYSFVFGPHSPSNDSRYIFVDDLVTAEVFHQYFQSLWDAAKELKAGIRTCTGTLQEIENQLPRTNSMSQMPPSESIKMSASIRKESAD